ncbi:Bromodomain-containing protein, partial [Gaertneriomyces semiglobifer]
FHEPVDVEKYPMYLQIVEKPMDLGTIKTNVEVASYKNVRDFVSDTLLIFANCLKFNPDP